MMEEVHLRYENKNQVYCRKKGWQRITKHRDLVTCTCCMEALFKEQGKHYNEWHDGVKNIKTDVSLLKEE